MLLLSVLKLRVDSYDCCVTAVLDVVVVDDDVVVFLGVGVLVAVVVQSRCC